MLFIIFPVGLFIRDGEEELKKVVAEKKVLRDELRELRRGMTGNKDIKKQLTAYNSQVGRLQKRTEQVDKILKEKTNPRRLLERVARDIPTDMWIKRIINK